MVYTPKEIEKNESEDTECVGEFLDIDGIVMGRKDSEDQDEDDYDYFYGLNNGKNYFKINTEKTEAEKEEAKLKEKAKARKKIPAWIEKGKKYIYKANIDRWIKCVNVRVDDMYNGMELDDALQIMKYLDKGVSFKKVERIFEEQNHSGFTYAIVKSIVLDFSKVGPAFIRFLERKSSPERNEHIKKIEERNKKYAEEESEKSQDNLEKTEENKNSAEAEYNGSQPGEE